MSPKTYELRPPRWLVAINGLSFAFFTALAAITIFYLKDLLTGAVLAAMAALALGGVFDAFVSHVGIHPDTIDIKGLFSREEIPTAEIVEVVREKSSLSLRLKSGKWKKMPGWIDSEEGRKAISKVLGSRQIEAGPPDQ